MKKSKSYKFLQHRERKNNNNKCFPKKKYRKKPANILCSLDNKYNIVK